MVMLRSNGDMDSSSEFLSLNPPQRKSARLKKAHDDSLTSAEDSPANEENNMRSRAQRGRHMVTFADMNGQTSKSPPKDEKSGRHLRKSPRLQAEGERSADEHTDDMESTPTSRNLRARIQRQEEDSAVRRSSRITRYKLDTRKQSVLYDRLITNTAEAVLQKMDDMQKMRRRLRSRDSEEENLRIYSGTKRKRITKPSVRGQEESSDNQENEYSDQEEEEEEEEDGEGEEEENDEGDEEDEDEDEEDNGKRYEFRQRKAVVRYQAPLDEPKKQSIFFKRHSTPIRRRYTFSTSSPRSLYNNRRGTSCSRNEVDGRRHAIHSSDSTSSSSSDEEKFERRRSKSRSRSINRCLPMNLRKEDLLGNHKDRIKIGASLADVDPMQIDQTVRFDSIGGLGKHISALKEMVVFPLLYPEVFEKFKIQPPRGCLFYGPPGTGKTLVARALANECSQGERKVSFFMRKGADCLSKWVGESERQLRLLFDQAYQMRPSIIFFDEIDGIAPVRSSRQDQIHSSIVSTLLALMDGLDSRGEVVVIGATNRLDSIDPALRRPGRFDREFLFSLPDREARKDILKIHTRQWEPQLSEVFLEELADKCVGYCGADIKAVCSEAALCALRRRYPQIYTSSQKLLLDVESISVSGRDFLSAMRKIVPASQRAVASPAKALTSVIEPLLSSALNNAMEMLQRLFPHVEQGLKKKRDAEGVSGILDDILHSEDEGSSVCITNKAQKNTGPSASALHLSRSALQQPTSFRPRLLLCGTLGSGQTSHLAPAILHTLEKFTVYTLDVAVLYGVSSATPEEACAQVFCEARRTVPSILYIPHIQRWWDTVSSTLKATFISLLQDIPSFCPCLLLATCSFPHHTLYPEVQDLFHVEYGEVFHVPLPSRGERLQFFEDLILNQASKPPASKRDAVLQALEVLPMAPPPPPRQLSEQEMQKLEEQEEDTLRELRLFLRDVTNRLAQDKRFKAFTKPVDTEEVPDYTTVIKQPMDLSTVLSKIDLHKYETVAAYLQDVDLIWQNALEYNPDRDPSDRLIRHRACALKDTVHAIIRDELDEDFEKICVEIKESRIRRGSTSSRFTPAYYHVLPKLSATVEQKMSEPAPSRDATPAPTQAAISPRPTGINTASQMKKKRKNRWRNGFIRRKKTSSNMNSKDNPNTAESGDEEEEEEEDGKLESEDAEKMRDVECESMETDGCAQAEEPTESTAVAQNNNIPNDGQEPDNTASAEDKVINVETVQNNATADHNDVQDSESSEPKRTELNAEDNTGTEIRPRRMTRGFRMQAEQQSLISVDAAMKILEQKNMPLIVDHNKLKELLHRVVDMTEGYEVNQLEKLYALLCQSIYRHRRDYDKTALIQEMSKEVEEFFFFFFFLTYYSIFLIRTAL
ncbi:ATPase family AAA domain-containing protein 2-like isoform X2 [Puntigrus tetrazona]|uniref:ATPase family AAA domain-containing protein 2-like isoform X2 n=1 Tax=Puntigrus tetrazona TaxID=1606681 RepID=UPI001C891AFF|nr:ATPase family AAA domain-containing protein 2-like isoform X2 [Puntigrus tetrazona]